MLRSKSRPIGQRQSRPATRISTICVVDPQSADYGDWDSLAHEAGAQLQIVASAEAALRISRTHAVDLWVVNTDLPGLSGFELCSMLKSRTPAVPVYLVADEYSVQAEREALQKRATLFGVKPAHTAWLDAWRRSISHAAVGS